VVGPSFSAAEVPEVIEAVINMYLELRLPASDSVNGRNEYFIETLRRTGQDPFKLVANSVRQTEPALA
jgi:sulfite reductase (NADPH) hemoprotein beta-component